MTNTKKKLKSKAKKQLKKAVALAAAAKAAPAIKSITGSGDYRPTQFARLKGRGDYAEDIGGALGRVAGGALGNLANKAWGGFKQLMGFGDYRARTAAHNAVYKKNPDLYRGGRFPMAMSAGANAVQFAGGPPRVQHREYVGPVYGGSGFVTRVYRIQPGQRGVNVLMPWGSSVASCFQQYKLHGMILEFVSTSSDYSATSALGSVMMSTLYDSTATPLASVLEIDNNDYTTMDKPSESFIHPIECATEETPVTVRYVRSSNQAETGNDSRWDDVGIFQLSTNGLIADSSTQIGELWCNYDIEFLKPALPDLHAGVTYYATFSGTANLTVADFTSNLQPSPENSLHVEIEPYDSGSGTCKFTLPVGYNGNYMAIFQMTNVAAYDTIGFTPQVIYQGSDISTIELFASPGPATNARCAASTTAVPSTIYGSAISITFFSTIAQSVANNFIKFQPFKTDGSSTPFTGTIWFIPVDNDIAPSSVGFSKILAKLGLRSSELSQLKKQLLQEGSAATSSASAPSAQETSQACHSRQSTGFDMEHVDDDMSASVHVPRALFAKMLEGASALPASSK